MIQLEEPVERAFLVGAPRRGSPDAHHADEHLDELARLADTAGAQVVGRVVQRVGAPTPKFYLGKGKVGEVKHRAEDADATLIVFDEELTPAQGKALEDTLGRRIMDRSELILDIFATRARSKEAKLEVELAQLEYLLPRLARMWVHLSRIRGGIGLRGPGETQIETDRRLIRRRISRLKEQLEDVAKHREVIRSGRRGVFTAALVGYTNAGKSSVLRALTGANAFVEDRLFATLDTKTREMRLNGSRADGTDRAARTAPRAPTTAPSARRPAHSAQRVRLIDTVGFIRKLPHHLVASFRATLEEVSTADLLLHVIDASHPQWEEQVRVVNEVLADVAGAELPVLHVFNKMDRLDADPGFRALARLEYPDAVFVSAAHGDVGELERALGRQARFPLPASR
jgi:GTP-binding protein HflX